MFVHFTSSTNMCPKKRVLASMTILDVVRKFVSVSASKQTSSSDKPPTASVTTPVTDDSADSPSKSDAQSPVTFDELGGGCQPSVFHLLLVYV